MPSMLERILAATSVTQVIDILEDLDDPKWRSVGGRDNNLATINLGSDPAAGIIERVTNAIDSVMDLEWERRGQPTNVKSPREAVDAWFGVPEGRLGPLKTADLLKKDFKELSSRVRVTVRGSSHLTRPTIDIRDLGTGLLSQDFEHTILSLNQNRKLKKFFLAGAFGQGACLST